jgi:plastocyanin
MRHAASIVFVLLIGCSGVDDTNNDGDSGPAVAVVDCASVTPAVTIATIGMGEAASYDPSNVDIAVGRVVRFAMPTEHDVAPDPPTDANVSVQFGETKCLRFARAGTYEFHCTLHAFRGSIVVH